MAFRRTCERCGLKEWVQQHSNGNSVYCRDCNKYYHNVTKRKIWKDEHKCLDCGKEVEPIVLYPTRCGACRNKPKAGKTVTTIK